MSLADHVWLVFLVVGVISGLLIALDECIDAYKRSKAGDQEDLQP